MMASWRIPLDNGDFVGFRASTSIYGLENLTTAVTGREGTSMAKLKHIANQDPRYQGSGVGLVMLPESCPPRAIDALPP